MRQQNTNPPSRIVNVSLDDFQQQALDASADFPVLVVFRADWCPPCIAIAPILEKIVNETKEPVRLAKLEADAENNMRLPANTKCVAFQQ